MHPLTPKPPGPGSGGPPTPVTQKATELALRLMEYTVLQSATQNDWLDTPSHEHMFVRVRVPPAVREFLGDANRMHWRKAEELGQTKLAELMPPADVETAIFSHFLYLGIQHLMACENLSTQLDQKIRDAETELARLLEQHLKGDKNGTGPGKV